MHVVLLEPERIRRRAHDVVRTAEEFLMASWHNATVGNDAPIDLSAASYRDLSDVRKKAVVRGDAWWRPPARSPQSAVPRWRARGSRPQPA